MLSAPVLMVEYTRLLYFSKWQPTDEIHNINIVVENVNLSDREENPEK